MSDDGRAGDGIFAARLRLWGAGGLHYSETDVALLRACLGLGGVSELTLLTDPFGYDLDSMFRIDEERGMVLLPSRLGLVIEAALGDRDWAAQVTQLDLHIRAVR